MKILGLRIPFTSEKRKALETIDTSRGWYRIFESYAGAWQQNVTVDYEAVSSNPSIFACTTLIASDISKLRVMLVAKDSDGVWNEITNPAYSPVLRKPNHYQTRIQFFERWMLCRLQYGNVYVLKQRDLRGVVVAMHVLDPCRVRPMLASNGDVFYEIQDDRLAGLDGKLLVPAREIIHDRYNCLWHPLVGIPPVFAAGLSGTLGLAIQNQATKFFENGARPGGILTAPGAISDANAARLKAYFDENFSGANAGKVAVVGDGLTYAQLGAKAVDSQLAEQWKLTAEVICSVYHVPPYKIGVGSLPSYNNVQALNVEYYSQALQSPIEHIEACLDEGLGLVGPAGDSLGTEFDLDGLLRMDSASQLDVLDKAKTVMTLDERRKRLDMPKLKTGGATVYLQEQDHSIEAIAARDKLLIEQSKNPPAAPALAPPEKAGFSDAKVVKMFTRRKAA